MHHTAIVSTTELLALGYDHAAITRAQRAGDLHRLIRGRHLRLSDGTSPDPGTEYLLACHALGDVLHTGVLSHHSAAAIHGLLRPRRADVPLHYTLPRASVQTDLLAGARRHSTTLRPDEIVTVDGCRVTTVARTVVDTARESADDGIVAASAALRNRLVTATDLGRSLADGRRRKGIRRARMVVPLADGLLESPGEAISLLRLYEHSLPRPLLQREIVVPSGRLYRPDFLWEDARVIGEFDGVVKYGGADGPAALVAEKRREDDLRAAGYVIRRWVWADLYRFEAVAHDLRRLLGV